MFLIFLIFLFYLIAEAEHSGLQDQGQTGHVHYPNYTAAQRGGQ
jgi:hypothetical protein